MVRFLISTIKKLITGVAATAAACALASCASISVTSNVNSSLVHTVHCHTFAWAGSFHGGPLAATLANPVNEARLRSAIQTHLQAVGVQPVTSGADCLVGYGIGLHHVLEGWDWAWGWGWGWGYGWGPWWGGPYVYPEAIIAVDLYDAHSDQPVWHAYAREDASDLKGDKAAQGIDAAVVAIFTKYPG
jgi:hypothetical protein